jgi:hypothetical protein
VVHTLEDDCTFDISVNGRKMATMHKLDKTALLGTFECNSAESYLIEFYSQCIKEMVWDTVISNTSIQCETSTNIEDNTQTFTLNYDYQLQQLNISNPEGHPLTVQMVDIYGRRMYVVQSDKVSSTTSMQGYITGVYIITVVDKLTSHRSSIKLAVTK